MLPDKSLSTLSQHGEQRAAGITNCEQQVLKLLLLLDQAVFMNLLQSAHVRDEYTGSKFLLAFRTDYNSNGVTDQSHYPVRDIWAGRL